MRLKCNFVTLSHNIDKVTFLSLIKQALLFSFKIVLLFKNELNGMMRKLTTVYHFSIKCRNLYGSIMKIVKHQPDH